MDHKDKNLTEDKRDEKDIEYTPEAEEFNAIDKKDKSAKNTNPAHDSGDSDVIPDAEEGAGAFAKLREKLALAIKEKQEYLDKWQRDKAEFINSRKRDEVANEQFRKFAAENLMSELLPVLESFNMAFNNREAWERVDKNWRTGVEYIANQLKGVLEANGLKELDPLGEKFNPMRDEALEFREVSDESKSQIILAVVHKGYKFYDRILKAPRVIVGIFKNNENLSR